MESTFLTEAHQILAQIADKTLWDLPPEELRALDEYAFSLLPLELIRKAFETTHVSFTPQRFQPEDHREDWSWR